ncbi:MAG: DMT family transporter [Chloroflexi bacterium]|nr:DMT family transporter [Chloroflexota bacterium]MXY60137.1 DMT family transporter [Chloroflexota bacterium]MYB83694.1 DMT family transporter [Chloroflexota bacterium]
MIFGALLSLSSALSFSVNAILVRRGIAGAGATASQGAFITVLLGVPFGFAAVVITGQVLRFGEVAPMGYLLLLAAGIVHFGVGRYCNYRSVEAIGAARSGPIMGVTTPFSVLMAVILLDEVVTLTMLFAIGLVLLGPAVILERRPRTSAPAASSGGAESPRATRNPLELRFLEGYVFATLAAVAYGTSPLLIRAALMDATRTAAIGTFVAYFGASAVLLATLVIPGRRQLIRAINLRYMRLFGGAGLMVFLAQLLRFFALSVADVSVVTPLQRMANVFTVILTWIFNRSLETITLRVVIGVLVSFGGSALLVYEAATR